MSRKILGLDIRYDAVSAVLVNCSISGNRIEAHAHIPVSNQHKIEDGIAEALETITETMDIAGSVCVASFPADQISFRNITVPFKEEKKIRQILPFELEPTFPFPVEDLIIDFQIIRLSDSPGHKDIIAAAIEKPMLKSFLDVLASFDIEPEIVTVGGYAVSVCLSRISDTPENWLFLDIDNNKSTIFVAASGQVCLVRSFSNSSGALSMTESICTNINRTLAAFEDAFISDYVPDEVFVTGGGISDDGFEENMAKSMEIPVKRIELGLDTKITIKNYPVHSMKAEHVDNAFALALIEIAGIKVLNFRKGPFAPPKKWVELKKDLMTTGMFICLVIIIFLFNTIIETNSLEKKVVSLNNHIMDIFRTTFPDVRKIVDPLHQMRVKIKEARKHSLYPGETEKKIRVIDILNEISKFIPEKTDVVFTGIVVGPESVQINGDTDTFNSVNLIQGRLEQTSLFQKVTISSANVARPENRIRFKLKIHL